LHAVVITRILGIYIPKESFEWKLDPENHRYTSNFVVENCRYDILLGMPLVLTRELNVLYAARVVRIADKCVPVQKDEQLDTEATIENLNVTSFRKLLKRIRIISRSTT
jgi:hypothetical protein